MTAIPDFTRKRDEPLRFTIDGDTFECAPVLPAAGTRLLLALAETVEGSAGSAQIAMIGDFLDTVMLPESAERFAARMKDPARPIDDDQIGDVLKWLVERYGQRPTVPPTPSDGGRPTTGTISMDGVPQSAGV